MSIALPIPDTDAIVTYASYTGSGPLAVPFPLPRNYIGAIHVSVNGVELASAAFVFIPDSTVPAGYPSGVVTLTAAVTGATVVIWRDTPITRTSDYLQGPLDTDTLNVELSRLTMQVADQRLKVKLGVVVPAGVASLASANIFTANQTIDARLTVDPAYAVYDTFANVCAPMVYFGAGSQTIAAGKQLNLIRADNTWTPGAGSIGALMNFNLVVAAGADATANVYGVIGGITNNGPATAKAGYFEVIGAGATTGAIVAIAGAAKPGASTANAYGVQLRFDSTNRKVDRAITLNATTGTAAVDYGFISGTDISYGVAWLQGCAVGAGNAIVWKNATASANLFVVAATGATTIGTNPAALGQMLSVQGFGVFGTAGGVIGFFGDTGAGSLIFGSQSNHDLTIRTNNTNIAAFTSGGTFTLGGSPIIRNTTAIPAGGTAGFGYLFSSTSNFGMFFGSGAPTLAAAKGSIYLRSDGSSTSTRAYVNTDGSTGWTAITTAT